MAVTNCILQYWDRIQSGEAVVSRRVRQQYQKIVDELQHPRDPWVFDLEKATAPIEFIERFCRHSKGKWIGQPVRLELWQKALIQAAFGFVHKETGLRRHREVLLLIGRKNGKSTLLAGLGLYMLVGDGEGGAEVYSLATKRDQARIVFAEHAVPMVSQSPALRKHLKKRKTDLYFPVTFGKFEPLASESHSLDGLNSHCVIIDELHAIKDRNLYDVMRQSMAARTQPLLFMITTAGFVRECIYDDMYDYACRVLDDEVEDERFLAFLYELDDRAEWTDFRAWEKANPGLGTIKSYEELAANVERAKNEPNFLPTVLTKDFNVRETVAGTWLTFEQINNEETFALSEIENSYAVTGTDLSSTTDLSCATILVMKPDGKKYVLQQYFLPEELVEQRTKEDRIPYDRWSERGLLTLCPGNKVDYSMVTQWYLRMYQEHGIHMIWNGYDPWNSQYWVDEMKEYGFQMEIVRQGAKTLSQPMKELAADLAAKRINYNNNPILKWCLTNTSVKRDDNDNIRPIKGSNQRQRIDGAVSLLIAYTVLFNHLNDYKALI